jgi:hypothetical protein
MTAQPPGWSPLGKSTLALGLVSSLFLVVFVGHEITAGTIIPHQDPTPERIEYERFHNGIGVYLFVGSAVSVLASFVVGMAWFLTWSIKVLARSWVRRAD